MKSGLTLQSLGWILLLAAAAPNAYGEVVVVLPGEAQRSVGQFVQVYEDPSGELSYSDVRSLSGSSVWTPATDSVPNLGYTDSTYWVRLDLDFSKVEDDQRWLFEIAWPHIDDIRYYVDVSDGSHHEELAGLAVPFDQRSVAHRNPVFRLDRVAGLQASIYLAVRGGNAIQLPLHLWTRADFLRADHDSQYVLGFVYGMFLVMLLYSLALYCIFRERAYLHYVGFTACVGLLLFTIDQLAFEYLWPSLTWWAPRAVLVLAALAGFAGLLFFRSYLQLATIWPRGDRIMRRCQYALAVGIFIPCLVEHSWAAIYCLGLAGLGALLGLVAVAKGFSSGVRSAVYLLWAWGPFLLGTVLIILRNFQILPAFWLTNYGLQMGASLGVFVLAVAVAARVRDLELDAQRQKDEAQLQVSAEMGQREVAIDEKADFIERVSHEMQVNLNAIVNIPSVLLGDYVRNPVWVCPGCEAVFEAPSHPSSKSARETCPECGNEDMRLEEEILCQGTPFEHIRMLERLETDARDLLGLVHNVLSYSELAEEQLTLSTTKFGVRAFFDDIHDAVGREASDKLIALDFREAGTDSEAWADRDKLMLVAVNLVQNAIKFTPKRGHVQVEWRLVEGSDGGVQELSVKDNGMGIPEEEMSQIFARFTQAQTAGGTRQRGSGLGLTVARKLVDLHGGQLMVESKVGQGSTFTVSLPRLQE